MNYILIGEPISSCRAQHLKKRIWDVQQKKKMLHRVNLENQHGNKPPLEGPLRLEVTFSFVPKPSVMSPHFDPHIPLYDIDRLLNFIFEIGTGTLFENDRQIIEIKATKRYSDEPQTTFTLEKIHTEC